MGFNTNGQSYKHITAATTTVVKAAQGTLVRICINNPGTSNTITLYDNPTAASGTVIAILTAFGTTPSAMQFECDFATGLTIVTAATCDITVVYF